MPHRFFAGIDLGATNMRVVIANEDGEVDAKRVGPLPSGTPADVLAKVARTVDELARSVWLGAKAAAVGIALPGAIDPGRGTAESIANMPGWDNVPVGELLRAALGAPVAVENDANAAAVGEGWIGAAKGMRTYVFLALGTGIGGGVVVDGRLWRGARFLAGEVAFMPMTRAHVREPGWQHCLEGEAGGRAMAQAARALLGDGANTGDLFDAARSGHAEAQAWLAYVQELLAMAVCDIVALLDPDAVVFGGGVVAAQGEALLGRVRELVHRAMPATVAVLQSALGDDAQALGAVRLAIEAASARAAR